MSSNHAGSVLIQLTECHLGSLLGTVARHDDHGVLQPDNREQPTAGKAGITSRTLT